MENVNGSYKKDAWNNHVKTTNSLEFSRTRSPFGTDKYCDTFRVAMKTDKFQYQRIYEDGHCLIGKDGKFYIVASIDDIRNMIRGWILKEPFLIPINVLVNVVNNSECENAEYYRQGDFYMHLLSQSLSGEEIRNVETAYNISAMLREDSSEPFWRTIEELDAIDLYGKCVKALFEFKKNQWDTVFDVLVDTFISWGHKYLCEIEGGVFIPMTGAGTWFYVYEVNVDINSFQGSTYFKNAV